VSTPAKTSGSQSSQKTRPDPSLVDVRESTVSNELRAAAAARALSFYTYPADRSEFSVRAHRNMRIDAEWDAIRAKIAGTDVAFRHSRVTCVVATLDLDENGNAPGGWAGAGVDDTLDPSCFANVAPDGSNARRVVLGTLDVNQGVSLPAEELAGQFPRAEDPTPEDVDTREDGRGTNGPKPGECDRDGTDVDAADGEGGAACGIESAYEGSEPLMAAAEGANARPMRYRRAYLSNVCVLPVARRTGLGRRLMNRAMRVAKGWGVERLYVHVVADNVGARKFYEDLGFVVEAEESATFAAGLNRPRRLLLTQPVRDVPESEC
jgi:ribosomal protein S18 acetylase RimI-like enzyme